MVGRLVVAGRVPAGRVETHFETRVVGHRRGQPPAGAPLARAAVGEPEADIRRAGEPATERGRARHAPRYRSYHDYVYLVEDAVAGEGLALGWRRFIDRHIETGTLVAARDGFVAFDRAHFARLTERGRRRPLARQCLDFFDELSRRAEEP